MSTCLASTTSFATLCISSHQLLSGGLSVQTHEVVATSPIAVIGLDDMRSTAALSSQNDVHSAGVLYHIPRKCMRIAQVLF